MVWDSNQNQIDELLELYVLDLLDDDEAAQVERRLQEDQAVRDRVGALRGAASAMALELEPIVPPAGLKSRILDQARAERIPDPPVDISDYRDQSGKLGRSALVPWAIAAVLAIALVTSLLWSVSLRGQLDDQPSVDRYAVIGTDQAAGVSGELIVIAGEDTAVLTLADLGQLAAGEVYQVWLIEDEQPSSAGTFVPNDNGFANVVVRGDVESSQLLAITIEPVGGSPLPTTSPIILSDLSTAFVQFPFTV